MTGRSKIVLFVSVLLAVCVITTTVIYIVEVQGNGTMDGKGTINGGEAMDGGGVIAVTAVIVLALASIPFVYLTKVRRRKFEELLDKDYYTEYEIIKDAVMNSLLPAGTQKEIRNDVLDLMLSAQKAGKKVADAIGDTGSFVRDIL